MAKNYAVLADTIKIEDITSNVSNQICLHSLRNNYETFDKINICCKVENMGANGYDYLVEKGEDIGWLGYYIGQNTKLSKVTFLKIDTESICKEMSCNMSIKNIHFSQCALNGRVLAPFFKNNHNLIEIHIEVCIFGAGGLRQLSLAIRDCNTSVKDISIRNCIEMENGRVLDIIAALSVHPQLEALRLVDVGIGINECTALATLIQCTTTQLKILNLGRNNIDDEGLDCLVDALANGNNIQELCLPYNRSITIRGWKRVASLLEMHDSKLQKLFLIGNNMKDEEALVFATSLTNNSTLKALDLDCHGSITDEGWAPFRKLLCDGSSVNKTYLSNHTLEQLNFRSVWLDLNRNNQAKQRVAMRKILYHHSHFNMKPLFEWEVKVLPIMIKWFEKAASLYTNESEGKIQKMRLDCIYDFIKEFPMLYIEPITRKEIAECTALEEKLQGDELEKIRQRKARALRRL